MLVILFKENIQFNWFGWFGYGWWIFIWYWTCIYIYIFMFPSDWLLNLILLSIFTKDAWREFALWNVKYWFQQKWIHNFHSAASCRVFHIFFFFLRTTCLLVLRGYARKYIVIYLYIWICVCVCVIWDTLWVWHRLLYLTLPLLVNLIYIYIYIRAALIFV